jgi:hypothetical protein
LCWITGTEQQSTSANDILFWNQVIEADQLFFPALCPLLGGRILFIPRCVHFDGLLPVFVPSFFPSGLLAAFMVCFQRFTTMNICCGQKSASLTRRRFEAMMVYYCSLTVL